MPIYVYRCDEHGEFEVAKSMKDAASLEACPVCQMEGRRVFLPIPDNWKCEGAHKHDYTAYGSKLDALNRKWSAWTGEPPPPPAPDKPKDSDLY